jgi:hypothetical protein
MPHVPRHASRPDLVSRREYGASIPPHERLATAGDTAEHGVLTRGLEGALAFEAAVLLLQVLEERVYDVQDWIDLVQMDMSPTEYVTLRTQCRGCSGWMQTLLRSPLDPELERAVVNRARLLDLFSLPVHCLATENDGAAALVPMPAKASATDLPVQGDPALAINPYLGNAPQPSAAWAHHLRTC